MTATSVFWEPTKSETFYLIVSSGKPLPYRIKITISDDVDDFCDDVDSAHEITVGETITDNVRFAGELDIFSFAVQRGVTYQIEASSNIPKLGLVFEGFKVDLIDHKGIRRKSVNNRVIWEAPYSGQHYIRVAGDVPATYPISVSIADLIDDPESDTTLKLGETTHGVIGWDDVDFFEIDLTQGETFEIDIDSAIKDEILVDVQHENRGLFGVDRFLVIWTPAATSSHVVRVRTPDVIGAYSITVRPSDYVDDHPDDTATPVEFGVPIEVYAYDWYDDAFTFVAEAGQSFDITVELVRSEISASAYMAPTATS